MYPNRCQAAAAEKAAAAHEKEMEVARLRALQEKVLDTRSQEDELRARRYQVGGGGTPCSELVGTGPLWGREKAERGQAF